MGIVSEVLGRFTPFVAYRADLTRRFTELQAHLMSLSGLTLISMYPRGNHRKTRD